MIQVELNNMYINIGAKMEVRNCEQKVNTAN